MATKTQGCSKRVWNDESYDYFQCSFKGKVERDGKWYCGTHDPEAVVERRKKRGEKWAAENEESSRIYRRRAAEQAFCAGVQLPEGVTLKDMLETFRRGTYRTCFDMVDKFEEAQSE